MNKQFLPQLVGGALVCLLVLGARQQAHAQGAIDGPTFRGNSTGSSSNSQWVLAPNGQPGPYIHMFGNDNSSVSVAGSINYIAGYQSNPTNPAHSFQTRSAANGNWTRTLQILQNGQVIVGTGRIPNAHTDYKLAVDGKVVSTSLYVTNPSNWADFVFAPSYKLMPLPELESYLKVNHHLPAIPAAREVETEGYNVTEMDAKLLRSVEELTLHVIELSKQNTQMRAELNALRATAHGASKAVKSRTR